MKLCEPTLADYIVAPIIRMCLHATALTNTYAQIIISSIVKVDFRLNMQILLFIWCSLCVRGMVFILHLFDPTYTNSLLASCRAIICEHNARMHCMHQNLSSWLHLRPRYVVFVVKVL